MGYTAKVGGYKTKRNPKSLEARKGHGDAKGTQLGVAGSGHIKRKK